ncbi:short-chain dehydrogenase/reductase family 16C member 6 [Monomorium pharaonis]|uniref:short-chain dehydrogenase/reductase family 16C member 6 n=1 Tax=Monomorium pharaonis TaxID=307658 RepID=UPI001747640B|nr:short-chain dehydrogenase/reductase family 16C member 6 [Monomorium pharaonis]XP_012529093.2 short-chain dehydrogenase/reductase family 16C member 6 [Monomorium pharaonis]XP_012529094.2 short-chain dehydrogenase/reductase family 16C member 6 [Monomorium pharaonis]XP_036139909.1 short-chain dehydrogenase/reductase family 16C member 6 [Monomorium pharaonis]
MLLLLAEILLLIFKTLYYICEDVYRLIVPPKKKSVAGEIVLITGAGHGIGKELAIGYASLGATVVCWDINEETNNQTMNDIKKMGIQSVYAYKCNVADREEVFAVAEKVKKEVGDVTILVNNAGIVVIKSFLNQSVDEIARVIDINVTAHFWTLKAFLPSMIEKDHGHIVALSSVAGLAGGPYGTVYCSSKFAVRGLMEAFSEELRRLSNGKSSIKFTTIYPGFVLTGFYKKAKIKYPRWLVREFLPQDVASSIIDAQRRNYENKTISINMPLFKILRLLPDKAFKSLVDFLDIGAYPED